MPLVHTLKGMSTSKTSSILHKNDGGK